MNYKAAGAPKPAKGQPRHSEHNAYGTSKTPFSKRPSKAELLARMKENAKTPKT